METSKLSYVSFLTVAQTGSVTSAAEKLNLSASVISRNIKRIEDILGIPLFDRSPQGMKLTAAGADLAQYATRAMLEQQDVLDDLRRQANEFGGKIRVATTAGLGLTFMPRVIAKFQREHSKLEFTVITGTLQQIRLALEQGDVDLGLSLEGSSRPELVTLFRQQCKTSLIMAPDHPLRNESRVTLEQIGSYPVAGSEGSSTRMLFERIAAKSDHRFVYSYVCNNIMSNLTYCSQTYALTTASSLTYREFVDRGWLLAKDFEECESMERTVLMLALRGRKLPRHIQGFSDFVASEAKVSEQPAAF